MEKQDNKDIVERLDDYLLSDRKPMKSKVLNDRHINVRLPQDLYETLLDWGYRHNRSLSHTIRGFLYLAEMENLYDLKEWIKNTDDERIFEDFINERGNKDDDE